MVLQDSTNGLLQLIRHSQSPYHSIQEAICQLKAAGFERWELTKNSPLEPGKAYYVSIFDKSLAAFRVPAGTFESFRIATSHIDNPCFMIKPKPERRKSGCLTLNVERYGGPILNTWLDRPLTIAGRLCVAKEDPFHPQAILYASEKPVAVIPNLAIHMNREVNKGIELKVQTDLEPVISLIGAGDNTEGWLKGQLAEELGIRPEDILDYELFLCNGEEPAVTGFKDEFISAPRLDNLTSCQSCLSGIIEAEALENSCTLSVLFDNEECGSKSKQGAGSVILSALLEKIYLNTPGTIKERNSFLDVLLSSFIVSLDVAHATHPNHPEKNDPTNLIPMDAGVVIKMNYNQRYATDARAVSVVEGICRKKGIAHVKFVNQGDATGGSTLGSILSTTIPAMTADLGVPILAMHSSREFMALSSQYAMDRFVLAYFSQVI